MANTTDWLNISQESGGTGQTSLTLTALTNSSLSAKTATITAKNDTYNVSGTSTVTIQGFVPTLTLSRSTLRFDSTGGTATFTVYSNTAWTITFPALVHSYSTSAGTGDTEVTVVLSPNPDEVAKIDTGIVEDCYGVNSLYLTIVQEAFIAELTVEPDDDIEFVNTGSSTSVTITTNTDWDISCPSWVTASSYSGESGTTVVTFTAAQNGPTDRTSTIDIYAGSKSVSINVFQPLYIPPYITVTPSAWTFNYTEDGKTFVVDSYPGWGAEVVSTGETVWSTGCYIEATYNIPSSMTMAIYVGGNAGDVIGAYYNAVKVTGGTVYFPTNGTYKIRYEVTCGGYAPSLNEEYIIAKVQNGSILPAAGNYVIAEYNVESTIYGVKVLTQAGTSLTNRITAATLEDGTSVMSELNTRWYSVGEFYRKITFPNTGKQKVIFWFNRNTNLVLSDREDYEDFIRLPALTSVVLGNEMKSIAFYGLGECTSLSSVTLGTGVIGLDRGFSAGNGKHISIIVCKGDTQPSANCFITNGVADSGTLFYPAGSDYTNLLAALNCNGRTGWVGVEL